MIRTPDPLTYPAAMACPHRGLGGGPANLGEIVLVGAGDGGDEESCQQNVDGDESLMVNRGSCVVHVQFLSHVSRAVHRLEKRAAAVIGRFGLL
jgi:hypothetical protein